MNKKSRQNALLEIVHRNSIFSQVELAYMLGQMGFKVTQASVSRDLDELGLFKQDGKYVRTANIGNGAGLGAVTFDTAGDNLIVGRCSSGLASAITVRIDQIGFTEIVGTIAGDDTIFVAVKDIHGQRAVLDTLTEMFR